MTDQKMPQKPQPVKTTNSTPSGSTARAAAKKTGADKLFYMKFYPDFIDTLRTQICAALALETHAELPLYFQSPYAFPAAIGLRGELEKRYDVESGSEAQKTLSIILSRYFGSSQYSNAMCDMPKRYTLDMALAEDIQSGDRLIYRMKLRARIKSTMEKRKRERENSQSEAALEIPAETRPVEAGASCPAEPEQTGPTLLPNA